MEVVQKLQIYFKKNIKVYIKQEPLNLGRPAGHNTLLATYDHSEADFIAIGDDDLITGPPNWLGRMVKTAELFPSAVATGGNALSPVDIDHHFRARLLGYEIIYNGLIEFVHARGMNAQAQNDIAFRGNAMGNLVKLLHKFQESRMQDLIFDTKKIRLLWQQEGLKSKVDSNPRSETQFIINKNQSKELT